MLLSSQRNCRDLLEVPVKLEVPLVGGLPSGGHVRELKCPSGRGPPSDAVDNPGSGESTSVGSDAPYDPPVGGTLPRLKVPLVSEAPGDDGGPLKVNVKFFW